MAGGGSSIPHSLSGNHKSTEEAVHHPWPAVHPGHKQGQPLPQESSWTYNGIWHIHLALFHPTTNGQAEHMVQMEKDSLYRIVEGNWHDRLAQFLLAQHTTPSTSTGRSLAELLMGRKLTTLLDCLQPYRALDMHPLTDTRNASQGFFPGDPLYVENHGSGSAWVLVARVIRVMGLVSYRVSTDDSSSTSTSTSCTDEYCPPWKALPLIPAKWNCSPASKQNRTTPSISWPQRKWSVQQMTGNPRLQFWSILQPRPYS